MKIEYWYHALMVAGISIFILTGTGLLKAYPLVPTSVISLGAFFIGFGEWINHPLQTKLKAADAFFPTAVLSSYPRSNSFIGLIFDFIGFLLIAFGCYKLVTA